MAVYPSNIAGIGVKLWENAFQTISDISFFDALYSFGNLFFKNFDLDFFSRILRFEELGFERHWQIPRRESNDVACSSFIFFSTIRGGGVKVVQTVFAADLAPKTTFY